MKLIILAAGDSFELNGFNKLLLKNPLTRETILDQYIRFFKPTSIKIVLGYKAIDIMNEFPNFDYIINVSEDGWFGDSIGPHQHFTHSVFRAIESGKYLLRSANNGISAIINPTGNIENKVEFGQAGYIDFKDKKVFKETIFSKYGNKMFLVIILLYIFLIFSFNRIS